MAGKGLVRLMVCTPLPGMSKRIWLGVASGLLVVWVEFDSSIASRSESRPGRGVAGSLLVFTTNTVGVLLLGTACSALEKAEVSPRGSVVVAVTNWPAGTATGKVSAMVIVPGASTVLFER